jgi:hypothetical protein
MLVERNHMVTWDHVTHAEVLRAIQEYDRLGPEAFFAEHGFARTTTYELLFQERRYPPKAILGTALPGHQLGHRRHLERRRRRHGRTQLTSPAKPS